MHKKPWSTGVSDIYQACSWPRFLKSPRHLLFPLLRVNHTPLPQQIPHNALLWRTVVVQIHPAMHRACINSSYLLQNNVEIAQHKSLKERCEAAKILKSSQCPVPILVDTMEDEANQAYGAFPERLFIVHKGKIVYEGGMGPYYYDLTEVRKWLEKWRFEMKSSESS